MTREAACLVFLFVAHAWIGCADVPAVAPPPRCLDPADQVELVRCVDATGHREGNVPLAYGGTCCCTPRDALLPSWHAAGLDPDLKVSDVRRRYDELGIVTAEHHAHCNNLCEFGPHAALGGRCLVSPTPATLNFERVVLGHDAEASSISHDSGESP